VSEPGFAIRAEDQPAWAEIVRRAERGESVAVIAHGDHVADVVPSGELDRLRETIEVLSDSELVRDLQEGLADARAGRVFSAGQVAADLAARRVAGESASLSRTRLPLPLRRGGGLASCRCPPRPHCMSTSSARWPQARTGWASR
jgi:antitoxin (DNA-binding transcriptional repressor) of toxin-antitoxin stability system